MTPADLTTDPEPRNRRPLAVLVLGMHRSGTSVTIEILSRLGCWIGDPPDLIGASEYNPRGHFELRAAVEFDNVVLLQAGGTWDNPPAVESIEVLASTLRPDIDRWFGDRSPLAFKDPRLCLILPIWLAALTRFDVRIVHLLRDPHAVARSLVARNAVMDLPASRFAKGMMTPADALDLWAEYNRRACVYEDRFSLPRLFVWYDRLVDDPEGEVRRMAAFIGRGTVDIASAVGCVRPELRTLTPVLEPRPRRDDTV